MKKSRIFSLFLFALAFASIATMFAGCSISQTKCAVSVSLNDSSYGAVFGSGEYSKGETITIGAVANEGFEFVEWNDGTKDLLRSVLVTQSVNYKAIFAAKTKCYSLDKIEMYAVARQGATVNYCGVRKLIVKNNQNEEISGFDLTGQYGYVDAEHTGFASLIRSSSYVNANQNYPFLFYSKSTSANKFILGESTTLKLDWYGVSSNQSTTKSMNSPIQLNVEASSTPSAYLIYTDSSFGYEIYLRLNFVELN